MTVSLLFTFLVIMVSKYFFPVSGLKISFVLKIFPGFDFWSGLLKWDLDLCVCECIEIVDRDGKSSLLSLVKAFDSVLAVYEGFCNLKQVWFHDLLFLVLSLFFFLKKKLRL